MATESTQKWEYIVLSVSAFEYVAEVNGERHHAARQVKSYNTMLLDFSNCPKFHDYLNQLGERGWKLVGVDANLRYGGLTGYILMRPKQG